jgi:hypothetical protein
MRNARFARVVLAVAGVLLAGGVTLVVATGLIALADGTAAVADGAATFPEDARTIYARHPILDVWPLPLGIVMLAGSVGLGRRTGGGWRLGMVGALALAAYGTSQLPSQIGQMLEAPAEAGALAYINVALVAGIVAIGLAAGWDVWRARWSDPSRAVTS